MFIHDNSYTNTGISLTEDQKTNVLKVPSQKPQLVFEFELPALVRFLSLKVFDHERHSQPAQSDRWSFDDCQRTSSVFSFKLLPSYGTLDYK